MTVDGQITEWLLLGGDVRNRFSIPRAKKFLIPVEKIIVMFKKI